MIQKIKAIRFHYLLNQYSPSPAPRGSPGRVSLERAQREPHGYAGLSISLLDFQTSAREAAENSDKCRTPCSRQSKLRPCPCYGPLFLSRALEKGVHNQVLTHAARIHLTRCLRTLCARRAKGPGQGNCAHAKGSGKSNNVGSRGQGACNASKIHSCWALA